MSKKPEMTYNEAVEIVLTAAKTLIDGHGELPVNAKTPYRAGLAIRIVEKSLASTFVLRGRLQPSLEA